MNARRVRQLVAEFVGTAFLVTAVVGSGIAAQHLSPHDTGVELLENTLATAAALVAIILAIGPVSGAHLNPVVTLVDRFLGGIDSVTALAYMAAQCAGGILGTLVANAMFSGSFMSISAHHRATGPTFLAEAVATMGLTIVVFGVVRSERAGAAPFAVGSYIAAAYWFTSSTSFANPAVTVARMFSNTFAGIAPVSVPWFVVAQILGGALGTACIVILYPRIKERASEVIVPHEQIT